MPILTATTIQDYHVFSPHHFSSVGIVPLSAYDLVLEPYRT
jgi:hypothetical protein